MPALPDPRHELFCQQILTGRSATQAYKIAGFQGDRRSASRLRHKADIERRVRELLAARTEAEARTRELAIKDNAMSLGELLGELKAIGLATIADIVDWDENGLRVRPKAELTPSQLASIQEIREIEFFGPKGEMVSRRLHVKLHDKLGALEKVARNLGAYEPKERITMAQVDQFLRTVLLFLERHLGKDRLPTALVELRELSQEVFGQRGSNGTTH